MGGACSAHGEMRNAFKILVRMAERKRPLGRTRCRWEDNIQTDLREIRLECVNWTHLAQDRVLCLAPVNTVMNLRVIVLIAAVGWCAQAQNAVFLLHSLPFSRINGHYPHISCPHFI
jgi:hypothetical protein